MMTRSKNYNNGKCPECEQLDTECTCWKEEESEELHGNCVPCAGTGKDYNGCMCEWCRGTGDK